MPAKEISLIEKVKLAKSAAEQQKVYAAATEKTANAEERLAKAVEKKEKAAKQGLSKQGMDEYIKSVIEATEEVENLKKEQEAVGNP